MSKTKELPACPVETTLMLISDRWKVLINSVGDQAFTDKLFDTPAIRSLFRRHSLRNVDPRTEGYVRTFFCQGGYAVLRRWLNAEPPRESPEEIARLLRKLASQVMGV